MRPKNYKPYKADRAALVKEGEKLWKDTKLSTNGLSCNTCHVNNGAFAPTFAKPYPHEVAMAREKAGLKQVHLDEMVQLCMVVPMATKPLKWESRELAALTAYTAEVQKTFKPNPCAAKNPCAGKNPCAARK
jgi:cytochrome c